MGYLNNILELPGIRQNVGLAPYTWIKIGGSAAYFVETKTVEQLIEAIGAARNLSVPYIVIGGGSNILVSDRGFNGLCIRASHSEAKITGTTLEASAGCHMGRVAVLAANNELSGLEFALGLPGTLGGAIVGNAGAFEQTIADVVQSVTCLAPDGKVIVLQKPDLHFSHRNSILKESGFVVLSAQLALRQSNKAEIEGFQRYCTAWRRNRQPLDQKTMGSTFKSIPIAEVDEAIVEKYMIRGHVHEGLIGAAFFIDRAGFKGKGVGDAQVSEKHANFILNRGSATAEHVIILISVIKQKVRTMFGGLELQEEIRYIGF